MNDRMSAGQPRLMTAALALAARGWSVFPLQPRRKTPGVRDWEREATTDPVVIRKVWERAGWNVGVACGPSKLIVVDLDGSTEQEHGGQTQHGRQVLVLLAAEAGQMVPADTFSVLTPNGQHLYFAAPSGMQVRNTAGHLGRKIDTRAQGGYVVGAGSIVDGQIYRITCDLPPQPLPPWLLERLARRDTGGRRPDRIPDAQWSDRYVAAAVRNEAMNVADAAVGRRNHTLFVAAARLARFVTSGGLTEADVRDWLRDACAGHIGVHSFDDAEVLRTIDSGLRRGRVARDECRPASRPTATPVVPRTAVGAGLSTDPLAGLVEPGP
ncbi:MAG: bifunctional DNA primase/polymerase [Pseudonocardia sp.]|uniref:bifunctional DNA primase/polymerase n=1 Tax=Pseudonocardia sp. TaxID=60912 RepID=UPI001AC84007|nr:bifunctional DNA primase/polymerase [Pseudonocardia sp.]MBN9098141.1 bifunctional DNA primase/polymerase [Pseudonocardia sp.]